MLSHCAVYSNQTVCSQNDSCFLQF